MCLHENIFTCVYFMLIHFVKKSKLAQICKLGNAKIANEIMSMNANKEMLVGNADDHANYPDAYPDATNFNTDYADTDDDLFIKIMCLCCM